MRVSIAILAVGTMLGVLAALAYGQTESPASNEVGGLIARLADPDFHVRRDASARLRDIGPAALPALHQAARGKDPEVRARAGELIHMLEYQPVPGRPTHAGYLRRQKISTKIIDGRRQVEVDDEGRQITISEDDDGIKMTVSGETQGKPVTRTYTARTPEQLRADNPEAFAVYQRFANSAGDMDDPLVNAHQVFIQQGNVIILQQQFRPVPVIIPRGGDDLNGLRNRVDQAMDKAGLPPVQRAKVHNAIDQVEQAQAFNPAATPLQQEDQWATEYDKACDTLRKVLADNHLPDPGDSLPPPKSSRLGVNVGQDPFTGAITVKHILPHSRAEGIGLQDDDTIRKINGEAVGDVKDLRRLVTEHAKGLVVDVTRDGRDLRLEEGK